MDLLDHFGRMAANNRWSNDRLYRAVLALQPGEFEARARPASSRRSRRRSITSWRSICSISTCWRRAASAPASSTISRRSTTRQGSPQAQAAFDLRLIDFCDRLSAADLDRRVITDRREDGKIPERIGDLLAHLFIHQIHHRGQVHAMLSGTSVKPPQLDEFFLDYDLKLRSDEVERLGLGLSRRCLSRSEAPTTPPPAP